MWARRRVSVIDFMALGDTELAVANGEAVNPKFSQFGSERRNHAITFKTLARETFDLIAKPLTLRYGLFKSFIDNHFDEASNRKRRGLYHRWK